MQYPHLFSPYTIKGITFKNRIFASPVIVNRLSDDNGVPTAEGIDAYEVRAQGGAAQITLTETFVDFDYAARHRNGIDIVGPFSTYHSQAMFTLTEAIKMHGAVASIQLNHIGGVNHPDCIGGKNPIGPSAFVRPDGVQVDEMDEAMMNQVADNYAHAAQNAQAFGFDMVMLHGGHGWLLGQFLSPRTNKRTDKYGGSMENRARFPIMVIDRIRAACGPNFLIEYRVSADEMMEGGYHLPDSIQFCQLIQDKVDIIHVTNGIYHQHVETKAFSSMYHPHGCNVDAAAEIKKHVTCPVAVVGGINDPALAEEIIREGKADFVAMGRQMMADPEWPNKAKEGRADEIAPCLRCSCFNPLASSNEKRGLSENWACAVNPYLGRELRVRCLPKPKASRQVLVVGGGPGGMYAAITAAERGHQVRLVEQSDSLGGLLKFTDTDTYKDDLRRYKNSLIRRVEKAGIQVICGEKVTPDYILQAKPDAVIAALGSVPIVPSIPGIQGPNVLNGVEVYERPDQVGKRVVIIGGGLVGCETGVHLAAQGREVQLIEMADELAPDAFDSHKRRALFPLMDRVMHYDLGTQCIAITPEGVQAQRKDGSQVFYPADTVVCAGGLRGRTEEARQRRRRRAQSR